MSNIVLYCNDPFNEHCNWSGDETELVCTDEDPDTFTHCPHCDRSAPIEMANGLCDQDCRGYWLTPTPGQLWPGETQEEFGY